MNYTQALTYLTSLGNEVAAMKLGLDSVALLLDRLGRPQERFPSVIVAGTNGKGSTAAMLSAIARQAGLSTGLYTSPHLVRIEERIRVDGREVGEARFAELASRVRSAAEDLVSAGDLDAPPTFFEQVTAAAFLEFAGRRVDLAVLEVGMGGRLDATNVVDPLVAVVTPIALDHQQYLGETLAEIAGEKAAVIKPGAAAVIAHQPLEAFEVLTRRCLACEVLPAFTGDPSIHHNAGGRFTFSYETDVDSYERVTVGLRGRHQVENAMTAIHAAEALRAAGLAIARPAIVEGIARTEWPGRLDLVLGAPPILLDGAHNAAGAAALRAYLDEFCHCPVTLVFGALDDKDSAAMAAVLLPAITRVAVTRPRSPRAADTARLAAELRLPRGGEAMVTETVGEALSWALQVTPRDGLVCVAGSLYLVGEAKAWIASRTPTAPGGRQP